MKPTEFKKKLPLKSTLRHFPKTHLVAACVLGVALSCFMALFPSRDVAANRQPVPLVLSIPTSTSIETTADEQSLALPEEIIPPELEWKTLTVNSGDNLSLLFKRAGLNTQDVYEFTNSTKEAKELRKIFPGHQIAFQIDESGKLQQLKHIKNRLNSEIYQRSKNAFNVQADNRTPDIRVAYREAQITSSLIAAAHQPGVGMEDSLTLELESIFGWDVDFSLDIRKGDRFKVLFEEKFLDGERIGHGAILAAEFINQGETYRAVRYVDSDGDAQYYTPEGKSMRKDFLRTPLSFLRISANFNPKRLHPVLKTVRPHRGVDYAAPTGTPVWSTGDGRVTASGYSSANGNDVCMKQTGGHDT